jgi:hypothetical protein
LGVFLEFCQNKAVIWRRKGIEVLIQIYYQIIVIRKGGIAGIMFLQTA